MWVVANGGSGDDVLHGGDTEYVLGDRLRGGGGDDELHGHGGPDILIDGDRSGAAGADLLDGGPEAEDTVSYQGRTRPVRVDLSGRAPDGERGERDDLLAVESVTGGRGDDRLAGDGGRNVLDGHGGRDELIARAGDDILIRGGRSIACGAGADAVRPPRGSGLISEREFLRPGCETIAPAHVEFDAYPETVGRRSLVYRMRCPPEYSDDEVIDDSCAGTVRIREAASRRRLLARADFLVDDGERVTVRLTRLGRALSGRGVRATLEIAGPELGRTSWGLLLVRL